MKLYHLASIFFISAAMSSCCDCENDTPKSFTIHTIGDSTMAHKEENKRPETGWGECIETYLATDSVTIRNYAVNGRSSKSFINEGRWDEVMNNIKKGDYVLIQFGHNDQKEKDTTRYTNASTMYKVNLRKYINETREKGGTPILITSIVRRNFNDHGNLIDTHMGYPQAMREVAEETNTTLVDAQLITEQLVIAYGPEASTRLYNHLEAGVNDNYPNGYADNTHLNAFGANKIAGLIVEELKKKDTKLSKIFK